MYQTQIGHHASGFEPETEKDRGEGQDHGQTMSEDNRQQTTLSSAVGSSAGQLWAVRMEGEGEGGSAQLQCGQPSSKKSGCGLEDRSDCSTTAPQTLGQSGLMRFQPKDSGEHEQLDGDGRRAKFGDVSVTPSVNSAMCEGSGQACRVPLTSEPAVVLEASPPLHRSTEDGEDCQKPSSPCQIDAGRLDISLKTRLNPDHNPNLHPNYNPRSSEDEEDVDQHSCTNQIDTGRRDISLRVQQEAGSRGDCCEERHEQRAEDFGRLVGNMLNAAVCEREGQTAPGTNSRDMGPQRVTSDQGRHNMPSSAVWGGKGMSIAHLLGRKDVHSVFGSGGRDVCVRIKQEPPDDLPPPSPSQPVRENRHADLSHGSSPVPSDGLPVSRRIKQEPEANDQHLETLDHCSEERKAISRQNDALSGHRGMHTSCPDRTHPGTHTPGQSARHSHMRNVYVSFATASKKMKCEFPGLSSMHAFQENGQKMYSAAADNATTSSVDYQEKTSDFSDESDCETLPIHFEAPRRGLGNDSDCDTLPIHFEAPQRGLGDEMLYECGMCQIAFSLPAQCHEHVIQHEASDRCYVCSSCKASFQQISLLTQHVPVHTFSEGSELHYDNPKTFVCHVCSKVFRRLYELNRHQTIHSGNKPFVCDVCHKTFARGDELNRHIRVHSGIKPFACEECSRAFITKHELNQHKKSHSEHKPFICPICSRGFLRADKLFHHQQMHAGDRPFECEVCQKGFITQSELRQHQKIHTGLKPFVCEVCCKAYLKVNDLNRHMKMHTGQKPFACDVCGKAFHRTDILTRHKKIHTRTKCVRRGRPPSTAVAL